MIFIADIAVGMCFLGFKGTFYMCHQNKMFGR